MDWLIYALTGVVAGLLSGFLGIGGGLIIVPALLLIFGWLHVSPEVSTHIAIGSSFAIIIFTSLSSIYAHHKRGNIHWQLFKPMSIGIFAGTLIGVLLVAQVGAAQLHLAMGIYAWAMALKVGLDFRLKESTLPSPKARVGAGLVVGWISSWFGIGGGTLTLPLFTGWRVPAIKAVGTAGACGLPVALTGAMANAWVGWGEQRLPEGATGYLYWPAILSVVCFSIPSARLGVRLASHLSEQRLKQVFVGLLSLIGARFIFFAG